MTPDASTPTIAGFDSGAGAWIWADLTTVRAVGVSAAGMVTARNTRGVCAVGAVSPAIVTAQIALVPDDIPPQAIRIGRPASSGIAETDVLGDLRTELEAPPVRPEARRLPVTAFARAAPFPTPASAPCPAASRSREAAERLSCARDGGIRLVALGDPPPRPDPSGETR